MLVVEEYNVEQWKGEVAFMSGGKCSAVSQHGSVSRCQYGIQMNPLRSTSRNRLKDHLVLRPYIMLLSPDFQNCFMDISKFV